MRIMLTLPLYRPVSRLRSMYDEVLNIDTDWPGTTIDGEPGLVSGSLTVSRAAGGEFLLNLVVGPYGARVEECDHVEFPLSADHAKALRDALAGD
jgi:hypothetical protein